MDVESDNLSSKRRRLEALDTSDAGPRFPRVRGTLHVQNKYITDPIHSSIEIPACLMTVIDTPQFQRLKGLKQLGAANYVYPGATHSRFEHSLGVAHLGMKFVKALKEKQPELLLSDMDVICVGLAGLCHDLGHGPFSHLFDSEFLKMKQIDGETGEERRRDWAHEKGSVEMLRYLLEVNGIDLETVYGFSKKDIVFVEELILGSKMEGGVGMRKGREPEKEFLYDIINNERSGFDVDKLDYILRDAYYTGVNITTGINVDRLAQMARVFPDENQIMTISFPEKAVHNLFAVFHARVWLHSIVYQHKGVKACEYMIRDILAAANPVLRFKSKITGKALRMSESVNDMSVFCQLKDSVLDLIELSDSRELEEGRFLLERLKRRDIYRCCGMIDLKDHIPKSMQAAKEKAIAEELVHISQQEGFELLESDFIVEVMLVHHGKGSSNPVDGLRFYSKKALQPIGCATPRNLRMSELDSPPVSQSSFHSCTSAGGARCFKIEQEKYGGAIIPQRMGYNGVRVFAKSNSKRDVLAKCFRKWSRKRLRTSPLCHNSQSPSDEDEFEDETFDASPPYITNNHNLVASSIARRQEEQMAILRELDD